MPKYAEIIISSFTMNNITKISDSYYSKTYVLLTFNSLIHQSRYRQHASR